MSDDRFNKRYALSSQLFAPTSGFSSSNLTLPRPEQAVSMRPPLAEFAQRARRSLFGATESERAIERARNQMVRLGHEAQTRVHEAHVEAWVAIETAGITGHAVEALAQCSGRTHALGAEFVRGQQEQASSQVVDCYVNASGALAKVDALVAQGQLHPELGERAKATIVDAADKTAQHTRQGADAASYVMDRLIKASARRSIGPWQSDDD